MFSPNEQVALLQKRYGYCTVPTVRWQPLYAGPIASSMDADHLRRTLGPEGIARYSVLELAAMDHRSLVLAFNQWSSELWIWSEILALQAHVDIKENAHIPTLLDALKPPPEEKKLTPEEKKSSLKEKKPPKRASKRKPSVKQKIEAKPKTKRTRRI